MSVFIIAIFVVIATVHLIACYKKLRSLRMATKPMLLALTALYYAMFAKTYESTVLIALLLGLIGDVFLLIPERPKLFVAGAFSFALGHLCYAYTLLFRMYPAQIQLSPLLILIIIPYVLGTIVIFRRLMKHLQGSMRVLMPLYMLIISTMSMGTVVNFIAAATLGAPLLFPAIMVAGSVFFVVSDTILAFSLFAGGIKRANFWIMLTYIIAQTCLTAGFVNF